MKEKPFKLIFEYLKEDKIKVFTYLFLVLITYIPDIGSTFFWGLAVEALISKEFSTFIIYLICWQSIHILIYSILSTPRDLLYNYLEIKFNKNVIKDLYHKITNLPAIAFEEIGVGEFINRMTNDPYNVMELLAKLMKMTCRALIIVVIIIFAFSVSLILGLEIITFAIVMGFISSYFFPKIKKTQETIRKQADKEIKEATENITGIREIKALGIKKNTEKRMYTNIDDYFKSNTKIRKYEVIYYNINNLIYFILQFIILLTSGYLLLQGRLSYSTFIIIESYIWRIDDVVESISDFGVNYNKIVVSLKRINDILKNKLYPDEYFGNLTLQNTKGIITFKNVEFKYRDYENNTLTGLNLTIEPNKKIAIVGKSGNGKSTIFNLLCRYFDTTSGEILIDNINIKDLTEESLRNNLSIIRQSPFLFNLSIVDNFKLVKENVNLDEIKEVCKKAYIHDYIMSLPNQYETIIGEGGINLSGGQKQRLAIARTLLLNTQIILFDEATSALDNESQEYIKKTIDSLVKDHTIVVVAHRLSTIQDADIIHIIDKGKLSASGTHEELLKNNKIYQTLYQKEI